MNQDSIKLTRTIQKLVKDTNINEKTLLATDYLNHFNEVIMLLELVPDMPECLDDVREWQPKSYGEHFADSTFSDKELAVLAYENAPSAYRIPFDETTDAINGKVKSSIVDIEAVQQNGNADELRETVRNLTRDIQLLMDRSSAIINGDFDKEEAQAAITLDQEDIDALFD
ncbi:MAG: hypothetical protein HQ483_07020 [Rhodospirillales bacterium]|nr:hypothetical protein [Rhodospirillales bacterium]